MTNLPDRLTAARAAATEMQWFADWLADWHEKLTDTRTAGYDKRVAVAAYCAMLAHFRPEMTAEDIKANIDEAIFFGFLGWFDMFPKLDTISIVLDAYQWLARRYNPPPPPRARRR